MSVAVRPFAKGKGWEVDIITVLPSGKEVRERRKARVSSKSAALRWGLARERHIIQHGLGRPKPKKEVPTVAEFVSEFLDHGVENELKPSTLAARETALRVHVVPVLGDVPLNDVSARHVQALRKGLKKKAPKTKNNVLSSLRKLLRVAIDLEVIHEMPCAVRLVKVPKPGKPEFHKFAALEQLLDASESFDPRAHLVVLLGADAGLRCGEMIALEWSDVDLSEGRLWVQRSQWKGHVTLPKGGDKRSVPLTNRLGAALKAHRHLQSPRVLCRPDGTPVSQKIVRDLVRKSAELAGVELAGVHALRKTFCSHLGLQGVSARVIQELAGHESITTTQRYLGSDDDYEKQAIRLLDSRPSEQSRGEIVESPFSEQENG